MAEFERDLIRERTIAGLATARARGKSSGRPPSTTQKQNDLIWSMYLDKKIDIKTILDTFKISKTKLYRLIEPYKANSPKPLMYKE